MEDTRVHAFLRGIRDGFAQGHLSCGLTYDGDPTSPRSRAYDHGATRGEWLRRWWPELVAVLILLAGIALIALLPTPSNATVAPVARSSSPAVLEVMT